MLKEKISTGETRGPEKKLYEEPDYAREFIQRGEIGPVFFHGQTLVIIPRKIYEKIGEDMILAIATELYGEDTMKYDIHWSGEAKNSYMLELPPKKESLLKKLIEELNKEYNEGLIDKKDET